MGVARAAPGSARGRWVSWGVSLVLRFRRLPAFSIPVHFREVTPPASTCEQLRPPRPPPATPQPRTPLCGSVPNRCQAPVHASCVSDPTGLGRGRHRAALHPRQPDPPSLFPGPPGAEQGPPSFSYRAFGLGIPRVLWNGQKSPWRCAPSSTWPWATLGVTRPYVPPCSLPTPSARGLIPFLSKGPEKSVKMVTVPPNSSPRSEGLPGAATAGICGRGVCQPPGPQHPHGR